MGIKQEWHFNSRDGQTELYDRYGKIIVSFSQSGQKLPAGKTATLEALDIASLSALESLQVGGGTNITKILKHSGTLTGIAAVGTNAIAVGTITGVGSLGVAVGDSVFGVAKANRTAGHVSLAEYFIPTTNVINVVLQNVRISSAGSYPNTGIDLVIISSS